VDAETVPVAAVRPFENLTGDVSLGHVGLGTARALTSTLSTLPGVVSRASTRAFAEHRDIPGLAKDLGVGFVVTGLLMAAGDRLQVNASLVRADDSIAWGGSFEGTVDNLFDLQRRLSQALVAALRLDVSPEARRRLDAPPTASREAYGEYSQARAFLERRDVAGNAERGVKLFESAITRDPGFGPAYAGLGEAYWALYREGEGLVEKARGAVTGAPALAPDHPAAH